MDKFSLRAERFSRYSGDVSAKANLMHNETKFFMYVRKSTDDASRQVRSVDDQIAELRELAVREQLHVSQVFIEKQTAKKPGRPIFNHMMTLLEKGEAHGILAWHPDRLSRNSVDAGRLIWFVDTKIITALRFPTYWFEPTAQGKFNLSIMLTQSKYYVDNLSENIQRGKRQKVKNGLWPGLAPVGYLNDRNTRGIVPDPKRAPLVRRAFELYATGRYTLDMLAEEVNALGLIGFKGQPLFRSMYHHVLQNPIYCGLLRFKGELHEGAHQPLVTRALFDNVQAVLARKSKPKTTALKSYLYRGFFRCAECGCFITTETQKGQNYLRCTKRVKKDCSQPYVRETSIAAQVTEYLRLISMPQCEADAMIQALQEERATQALSRKQAMQELRNRVCEIDQKLDRLMDVYLEQGITRDEFKAAKATLVKEKQLLKEQLHQLEENRGDWFEPALKFLNTAKSTAFVADTGTEEEKRELLKKIGSNFTISNRHLSVTPRGAWKLVVDQGSFAQTPTAPRISGAATCGELHPDLIKRRR